jgi:hypothetical protein
VIRNRDFDCATALTPVWKPLKKGLKQGSFLFTDPGNQGKVATEMAWSGAGQKEIQMRYAVD